MYKKINSDGTYTDRFNVTYDNIDYNLLLKPQTAIQMCQNTAVTHSDAAGYTVNYFRDTQTGWVLSGWHIQFTKKPHENQSFDITTWTKAYKKVQSDRSFIARDDDGNELFRAVSRWFLIDTAKRKPMRLPAEFFNKYIPSEYENAIEDDKYEHPELDLYDFVGTREFKVTRRDIDANGHTNNVSYLDWAIDDLSSEIYLNYTVQEVTATYRKEALMGDTICSSHYIRTLDDGIYETASVFTPADDPDCFLSRTTIIWGKLDK